MVTQTLEELECGHKAVCHVFFGLWTDPEEGHLPGDPGQTRAWLRAHCGDGGFLERRRALEAAPHLPGPCCSLGPAGAPLTKPQEVQVPAGRGASGPVWQGSTCAPKDGWKTMRRLTQSALGFSIRGHS